MNILQMTFWLAVALVAYSYFVYPLLVWGMARLMPNKMQNNTAVDKRQDADWPFISIVIAAYREESVIVDRVKNALQLDYPSDKLEIVIGCDGQEDRTGELVSQIDDARIRLRQFPKRRGKASVLNDCVPEARGDIVVLSDANTMMDADALKQLARHFDSPNVACVCGQLILTDSETGKNVDGVYWKYENFIKRCEGKIGALLGVNGAIYALRKEMYQPIPANTIIDDFLIGMRVHLKRKTLVYEKNAIAREETAPSINSEFHRRSRIGAGAFQSLIWLWPLLSPTYGRIAFAYWSHKVLRWFCPMFLLVALIANLILASEPLYAQILGLHVAFYLLAIGGLWFTTGGRWQKVLRIPAMFVSMNAALFVGFFRWISGRQGGMWKRTARTSETVTHG